MRWSIAYAACLICALVAGCYPVTRMQGPRTTPAGSVHGAVGLAVSARDEPAATPDVALRYGLTDRIDVGVRARVAAVEVGPKFQLVRDDVEVSIAPAFVAALDRDEFVEEGAPGNSKILAGRTTVYVGSSMDQDVAYFVAPTIDIGKRTYVEDAERDPQHVDLLLVPGVLGGVLFSTHSSVRILLELGLLFPVGGRAKVTPWTNDDYKFQTSLGPGDTRLEVGMALLFGSND
jgi:hypothetical protein